MPTKKPTPTKNKKRSQDSPSSPSTPALGAIAARAYDLFLQRGGEHGHDWEDWLQAERELLSADKPTIAADLR
jgi:DUF2934 family protein